ncbi:uncharacterized protein TNCV_3130681 [Trichonephila clavipes]|nr:uncharacterized protein TNCV_3130681 [Trichonephila clavipes]
MTSCNHICCNSWNGSQEPFLNKTMLSFTQQAFHKTFFALLLSFLGLHDSQILLQSSISGIIWDGELASYEFVRTRGKVTANMERNVSRHHTEMLCPNAR